MKAMFYLCLKCEVYLTFGHPLSILEILIKDGEVQEVDAR